MYYIYFSLRCAAIEQNGATTNEEDAQTGRQTSLNTCSFTRAHGQLGKTTKQTSWQNKPPGRLSNKQTN